MSLKRNSGRGGLDVSELVVTLRSREQNKHAFRFGMMQRSALPEYNITG